MNQIMKIIAAIVLIFIVAATTGFTYLQITRSQTLDENLVSNLTTQLDTRTIDQAISKIYSQ